MSDAEQCMQAANVTPSARSLSPPHIAGSLLVGLPVRHVAQQLDEPRQRLRRLIGKRFISLLRQPKESSTQAPLSHASRGAHALAVQCARASRKRTRAKRRILMTACRPLARSMTFMRRASAASSIVRTLPVAAARSQHAACVVACGETSQPQRTA